MKVCKVDKRGRLCLKKVIHNLPEYYELEENVKGQIVLTAIRGKDIEEAANFFKKDK